MVEWGGEVVNTRANGQHTSTQMGSGHFAEDGFGKASYFRNLEVVDSDNSLTSVHDISILAENTNCYNIKSFYNNDWGTYFYYGGPGYNPQCTWSLSSSIGRYHIYMFTHYSCSNVICLSISLLININVKFFNFWSVRKIMSSSPRSFMQFPVLYICYKNNICCHAVYERACTFLFCPINQDANYMYGFNKTKALAYINRPGKRNLGICEV